MAVWSLLHMASPLNTSSGTGQIGELTMATGRSMKFSLDAEATLDFDLPGHHPQAREVIPLVSDVLVFRDDEPVQRFRVVSRDISWGSEVTASFSAVSYKALAKAWIMHDESGDKKNWLTAEGAVNTASAAWTCFNYGQTRTGGNLGVTQGHVPASAITVAAGTLEGVTEGFGATDYFKAGKPRLEVINELSKLGAGFEWDITVDQTNPYTGLKFDVWALAEHGRHQHYSGATAVPSPFILDDGGNVLGGSHSVDPSEFANVGRFPLDPDSFAASTAVWLPSDKDPDPVSPAVDVPEGRWEHDFSEENFGTAAAATSAAPGLLAKARGYTPVVGCSLRRGRWGGPDDLWIGDEARFILTVATDDSPGVYLLNIDELVRVYEVSVSVDDLGAEDVSLSLNRNDYSTTRDIRDLYDRVAALERHD